MKKANIKQEQLLLDKFYEVFPDDALPGWFRNYVSFEFKPNVEAKVLELNVYLVKPKPLGEDYDIEEMEGSKVIVHFNRATGRKSFVISYDEYTLFYVFRARLNNAVEVEVLEHVADISVLKEKDFNLFF